MDVNVTHTSECSGCRRQMVALCTDCLASLQHPQCVCCERPVANAKEPHPLCATCERAVAAEVANVERALRL